MTFSPELPPQHEDDLQFDRVEPLVSAEGGVGEAEPDVPGASACTGCQQPLASSYYEVAGKTVCPACRDTLLQVLAGGSRVGRFLRAMIFGTLAAGICALIWGGIRWATGYEVGLVAIVVGLAVGGAVRAGSRRRGGIGYQLLAVLLTYLSITSTYVPTVIATFYDHMVKTEGHKESSSSQPNATSQPARTGGTRQTEAAGAEDPSAEKLSAGTLTLAILFVGIVSLGIAAIAPILSGDLIWLIIVAIALWEAWKVNRRTQVVINGPFQVSSAMAAGPAGPGADD